MADAWRVRGRRSPREILDRVNALEVNARGGTIDEIERIFRLRWHRGFTYRPAPLLVGRVREVPEGVPTSNSGSKATGAGGNRSWDGS